MRQSIAILTLAICLIATTAKAQLTTTVFLGINNSTVSLSENTQEFFDTGSRTGFFIGVKPSFQISDKFATSISVQYSQKGFAIESLNNLRYSFAYIDIIPEINYNITNLLSFGIGVNTGFRVNEGLQSNGINTLSLPNGTLVKQFDFGLTTNVAVQIKKFSVFARYNYGLINTNELQFTNENGQPLVGVRQFNRNLQVGLGYQFNL